MDFKQRDTLQSLHRKVWTQLAKWFVWLLAWTAEVLACTRGQQIGNFGHRKGQQ